MAEYRVDFLRTARKELEALPDSLLHRIWPRIEGLALEPRPRGARKLKGSRDHYRLRVGDYRVVYRVDDVQRSVVVVAIGDRKDIYG